MLQIADVPHCPICGTTEFGTYRGRANERCQGCGAKERTRLHYVLLSRLRLKKGRGPLFHLAPEEPIAKLLVSVYWENYKPIDIEPEQYRSPVPLTRFDVTKDLDDLEDNSVAGFVHSHVMEHIRAPVGDIIAKMNRKIRPGGVHFFCVPIGADTFEEDYSHKLTDDDRLRRFGQEDHVRVFGRKDFETMFIEPHFSGFKRLHLHDLITPWEAGNYALRAGNISARSAPQTFVFIKQ